METIMFMELIGEVHPGDQECLFVRELDYVTGTSKVFSTDVGEGLSWSSVQAPEVKAAVQNPLYTAKVSSQFIQIEVTEDELL